MGVAGFDRMALHTGLNPYFNQTWGYMAMPFALVCGWALVRPVPGRAGPAGRVARRRGGRHGRGRVRPHGAAHRAEPVLQPDLGLHGDAVRAGVRLGARAACSWPRGTCWARRSASRWSPWAWPGSTAWRCTPG